MNSFFKTLTSKRNKLSELEKQVLNYILEHPDEIKNHTISELSELMFASTATISRTCKKLGFKGLQELKYTLNIHQQEHPVEYAVSNLNSVADHLKRFEKEMKKNLQIMGRGINQEIIKKIAKSNHVEFFGVGSSLPICIEGARKMTFAGRIATARTDWDELRIVAQHLTARDLAIIVSLSGETLHIIEYANILKNNHVPILTISGSETNHLKKYSTYFLYAKLQTHYFEEVDMSSRFPLNIIIDLIIMEYLKLKPL